MNENIKKLPVGIQSFEKIRNGDNLYIDKTEYIFKLVNTEIPYFLSRPRRFGKSLLLSTMKAYWEGKRDLFRGLKIENLVSGNPEAWESHPVFYLDFNKAGFQENGALEAILLVHLEEWENRYGQTSKDVPLGARFGQLLRKACEQTGKRCAVLVDEYDKPLLETMDDKKLVEHNKTVFKSFFSCLKSEDAYIRFIFITGVTKFSKISIFSDLNQLRDISMTADYAGICGITEQEMKDNLMPEIKAMANELEMTTDECFERLKKAYDGYHFHHRSEGVCNPFSLLSALTDRIERKTFDQSVHLLFLYGDSKKSISMSESLQIRLYMRQSRC